MLCPCRSSLTYSVRMFVRFIVASQSESGGPVPPAHLVCDCGTGVAGPSPLAARWHGSHLLGVLLR